MKILDYLFGCWHKRYTFPIKARGGHYVCCLDCGKEFDYDWDRMRVMGTRTKPSPFLMSLDDADRLIAAHERTSISFDDREFLKSMRIKA